MADFIQILVAVSGCLVVDILTIKQIFNLTKLRKFCGFFGQMPTCILLCLINAVGCNTDAVVSFIGLSCAFMGLSGSAISPNYVDLAPPYVQDEKNLMILLINSR